MHSCLESFLNLEYGMQAILTREALSFIPEPIRRKLHLEVGQVLDFDETTPFLKAVPCSANSSDEFDVWLKASIGLAKGNLTTDERMAETRGED